MSQPKYINLDAVETATAVIVKLKGKEHPLKEVTVQDYIDNLKKITAISRASSPEEEFEVVLSLLLEAYPTMVREDLSGLTLAQLRTLSDETRAASGEAQTDREAKAAAPENPL